MRDLKWLIASVKPVGGNTHQENDFGALLEPKLRKVFYDYLNEVPEQYTKFFNIKTSKKAKETDYGLGAFREWTKFGKAGTTVGEAVDMPVVKYQKISPGQERTYVHEEYASGFMVEKKFVDDEMYDVINKLPKDLARAGRYSVERDAASLFKNAFTVNGYDGVPLISDKHPLVEKKNKDGGSLTIKGNNRAYGALSDATLKKALLLGRKQVDEAGKLITMKFDTLIVPPALEWLAMELTKTTGKPGTDLNDINVLKGMLKVEVYDFLESDTAWFVTDSKNHEINFFWRVKPQFNRETSFDSFVSKYNAYMRYSYGYSDFRGIIGSDGTTVDPGL